MGSNNSSQNDNNIPGTNIPKPKCKIAGEDGNIFYIMGKARRALIKAGCGEKASEMCNAVVRQESYEDALVVITRYVNAN